MRNYARLCKKLVFFNGFRHDWQKEKGFKNRIWLILKPLLFVGVTRFELVTPCSQSRCANRTALHPEWHLLFLKCVAKVVFIFNLPKFCLTFLWGGSRLFPSAKGYKQWGAALTKPAPHYVFLRKRYVWLLVIPLNHVVWIPCGLSPRRNLTAPLCV